MTPSDINLRLQPWLQRWSLSSLDRAQQWLQSMSVQHFAAGDMLVRAGERSNTLYLLDSGLVRLFYTTPDGKERNKAFFGAGQVTGPVSAAMTAAVAPFSIEALEPTESIAFPFSALVAASEHSVEIARLYRDLLAEAFIRNEQREAMLLTCNAQQRYAWLQQHEAHLLQRVAQFHIASYIGVDAVSLSRLKRKDSD